jgi:hypothetical protein
MAAESLSSVTDYNGYSVDSESVSAEAIVDPFCSQFTFVTYVCVFGAISAFGLVGNFLSWAVLGWERRNRGRVATLLLQTMAVVDNLFLLAAGVSQISMALKLHLISPELPTAAIISVPAISNHSSNYTAAELVASTFRYGGDSDGVKGGSATRIEQMIGYHVLGGVDSAEDAGTVAPSIDDDIRTATPAVVGSSFTHFIFYISAYVAVFVFPLVHVTQMWTVWITVLVAFNRYVAICRPFQVSQVCTMKQTKRQILALGVAILVYCLPRFFEYRIAYVPHEVSTWPD